MPKKVDHQQRREQIAAALMRVVANDGLEAVSLRHVAAEAGVTAGMVQHYFPSKEAMMDFAMQSASARYEAQVTEAIAMLGEDPPVRKLIRTLLVTMLPLDESGRANGRVALAFHAHAATRREAAEHLGEDTAGLRDFIAGLLRSAQDAGRVGSAIDPAHAAAVLVAVTDGLALHLLSHDLRSVTATAALDAQLDLIFGADARSGAR